MVAIIAKELNYPHLESALVRAIRSQYSPSPDNVRLIPNYFDLKGKIIDSFIGEFCLNIQNHGVYEYYGIRGSSDLIEFANSDRINRFIPNDEELFRAMVDLNVTFTFGADVINEPFESVW